MGKPTPSPWLVFYPFFKGICRRLLLLAAASVVVLIAWGRLGGDVGLGDLFWHEVAWHQILVGFCVTLLCGQLAFVAYLLDTDRPWLATIPTPPPGSIRSFVRRFLDAITYFLIPDPPGEEPAPHWNTLRWYLSLSWLPLLFLILLPAFVYVDDVSDVAQHYVILFENDRWCVVLGLAERWPFLLGVGWAAVACHVFIRLFGIRVVKRGPQKPSRWSGLRDLFTDERWLHRLAGVNFLILLGLWWLLYVISWYPSINGYVSPLVALCVSLGLLAGLYGFVSFHLGDYRIVLLLGLVALAFAANVFVDYKQRFPKLPYETKQALEFRPDPSLDAAARAQQRADYLAKQYEELCATLTATEKTAWDRRIRILENKPQYVSLDGTDEQWQVKLNGLYEWLEIRKLEAWKARMKAKYGEEKPRLVVVATSGGANRAALWTTTVLTHLEGQEELKGFAEHVRIVTGASGGMLGASFFVATLKEDGQHHVNGQPLTAPELRERIGRDSLTPVAQRMLFSDVPQLLLPFGYEHDRGVALEEAWDHNLDGTLSIPFRQLAAGEKAGWRPSLIITPMLVEDGRRLLISNNSLAFLAESAGSMLDKPQPKKSMQKDEQRQRPRSAKVRNLVQQLGDPSRSDDAPEDDVPPLRYSLAGFEFFRLFPKAEEFRLSTAIRMNATFPYVSPAVDLPTDPPRRVVDAGYYDNYGVNVAACWLHHYKDWLRKNTSGVLLIQIRDELSERRRVETDLARDVAAWRWSRGIEWLTGPAMGLFSAMESVMSFRNDEQVQHLHEDFNGQPNPVTRDLTPRRREFFTTVIFECPKRVAYNWYLSQNTKDAIESGFNAEVNDQALERMKEWWK